AGQLPLTLTNFYFDELVNECVRAVRTLTAKRELSLQCEAAEEVPLRGDEALLRRMILNLLDNAVKHTPQGGGIAVRCFKENGNCVMTVADTGGGIPPAAQPHIFERFYRADRSRSRSTDDESGGAGLGLSIAHWVAEAHQGKLELLRSDEKGTAFIATLPC